MAILGSHAILTVDAIPAYVPVGTQARLARLQDTLTLYYYNGTAWITVDLDAVASIDPDGNDTPITRGDAITGVEPTAGEIASPVLGDTASVFLSDGQLEKWSYNGTAWALAYTLAANEAANLSSSVTASTVTVESSSGTNATLNEANGTDAGIMSAALYQDLVDLIALSGLAGNSQDLGTFTGVTIPDAQNIKEALQALETALEAGPFTVAASNSITPSKSGDEISADLNLSASQDNYLEVEILADGVKITKQALTAYDSFAAATADVGLNSGDSYVLSVANLEGIVSDGVSGPVFVKA